MFGFEMLAASMPEAEQVTSAFYRCLEQLGEASGADGEAYMRMQQMHEGRLITVRLWSAEALQTFHAEMNRR